MTVEHQSSSRSEILAAACRCFARDGFEATSIAAIAAESGLSAESVFMEFKTKNEVISAVFDTMLAKADGLFAELLADDAAPSPEETVSFMVDAAIERAVEHPALGVDMSRVALHAWAESLRDPYLAERTQAAFGHIRKHYVAVVLRGQAAGKIDPVVDAEHFGSVLLGVVQAFVLQRLLTPGASAADDNAGARERDSTPPPIDYLAGLRELTRIDKGPDPPWKGLGLGD